MPKLQNLQRNDVFANEVFANERTDGTTLLLKDHCSIHTAISSIEKCSITNDEVKLTEGDNFLAYVTGNG